MKLLTIFTLFLTITHQSHGSTCKLDIDRWCIFTNVHTTETDLLFHPTSEVEKSSVWIIKFQLNSSSVHTFTNEICRTFPNLQDIYAAGISLKKIAPNALHACTLITVVNFNENQIEELDQNLFIKNPNLKEVYFKTNKLKRIDGKMFEPVTHLRYLDLDDNQLDTLPLQDFPVLRELQTFDFNRNNLMELDECALLHKFPMLSRIRLNHNLFNCNKLRIGKEFLKSKGIEILSYGNRTRAFEVTYFEDDACLNDIIFRLHHLRLIKNELKELQKMNIFKENSEDS